MTNWVNAEQLKQLCTCGHDMSCHAHTERTESPRECMVCDCPRFNKDIDNETIEAK